MRQQIQPQHVAAIEAEGWRVVRSLGPTTALCGSRDGLRIARFGRAGEGPAALLREQRVLHALSDRPGAGLSWPQDVRDHAQQGQAWLTYAYLPGTALTLWVSKPENRVIDLVRMLGNAARAVSALHGQGWIHGGITPDRLLVTEAGGIALTGLRGAYQAMQEAAPSIQREIGFTAPGLDAEALPSFSDVWSLAAVGAWALTGVAPIPVGSQEAQEAISTRLERVASTAEMVPQAPDALTSILDAILFSRGDGAPLEAQELASALHGLERSLSFTEQQTSLADLQANANGDRYGHRATGPIRAFDPSETRIGTARRPDTSQRVRQDEGQTYLPQQRSEATQPKGFRTLVLTLSLTAVALAAAALIWVVARTKPDADAAQANAGSGRQGSGESRGAEGEIIQAAQPAQGGKGGAPANGSAEEGSSPAPVPEPAPEPSLPPLPPLTADEPAMMEGGTAAQTRSVPQTTPEKITEIIWRTELKDGLLVAPLVVAGRVFAVSSTGRVVALDARDGKELWRAQLRSEALPGAVRVSSGFAVSNGKVIALSDAGTLAAFAAESGRELWKQELGEGSWGGVTALDRKTFVATKSGQVTSISDLDGSSLWTFAAGGEVRSRMSAANGLLFVPALSGGICENSCAYRNDGQCDDGGSITASNLCTLGSDCADCGPRTRVARDRRETGDAQTQLIALDSGLGQDRWRKTIDAGVSSEVIAQGSTLFVTDWTGRVTTRDAATGSAGAEVKLAGRSFVDGGSLGPAGLLLPSTDGSLTLLNPTTLAEIWKSQLPAKPAAAAVQTENMALVPLSNNALTALSLRTGVATWRFETRFLTAAAATATEQVTVFGNTAGSIYAIK